MLRQFVLALLFVAYIIALVRLVDIGIVSIHPRFAANVCRHFPAARFCPSFSPPSSA